MVADVVAHIYLLFDRIEMRATITAELVVSKACTGETGYGAIAADAV
jgi:hypothetical protein